MDTINRRNFLKTTSLAAGAAAGVTLLTPVRSRAVSPNEVIRVAVVGFNGRGMSHVSGFMAGKGRSTEIAALVDVDEAVWPRGVAEVEKAQGKAPALYSDIRKMLEDKSIDVVSIATPNHWHSLAALWSVQAGKDVYVEKPLSHNVFEGRKLVEAARKYKRIVQHGTQSRSSKGVQDAVAFLRSGKLGKIYMAKGLCYKPRGSIGKVKTDREPPKSVDYDLWVGPAPLHGVHREKFHYDWHWQWDYGNGDIGNQGVHQMDVARWGLGLGLPKAVFSNGGRFGYDDDGETPNTQFATFEYDGCVLQFEVRGLATNEEGIRVAAKSPKKASKKDGETAAAEKQDAAPLADIYSAVKVGNLFYGSEGTMVLNGDSWATFFGHNNEPGPSGKGGGDHFGNFIAAVKSRKHEDLAADVEDGHLSAALGHLANVSYRLGRKLAFDAKTEKFVNDREGDALLTRDYRSPFIVPEKV